MKKIFTLLLTLCAVSFAHADDDTWTVAGCYTVNGDDQASFFGTAWSPSTDSNDMTNENGTYKWSKNNVELTSTGTIKFKVCKDHGWGEAYPSENYTCNIDAAGFYDITITYNTNGNSVNCIVTQTTPTSYKLVYTVDDGESSWNTGDNLVQSGDNWNITVSATANMIFAIAPNTAYSNDALTYWTVVRRPKADGDRYELYTMHCEDDVEAGSDKSAVWKAIDAGDYTLSYNPSTAKFTIDACTSVNVSEAGWATYSNRDNSSYGYTITNADKVYYVSAANNGYATLTEIPNGTVIPDAAGIIVKATKDGDTVNPFIVTTTGTTPATFDDNLLIGTKQWSYNFYYNNESNNYQGYILAKVDGNLGFYKAQNGTSQVAHKAHIKASDVDNAANFLGIVFADESTGISAVGGEREGAEQIYNLAGQRQQSLKKGLNIVNGKKVLVK